MYKPPFYFGIIWSAPIFLESAADAMHAFWPRPTSRADCAFRRYRSLASVLLKENICYNACAHTHTHTHTASVRSCQSPKGTYSAHKIWNPLTLETWRLRLKWLTTPQRHNCCLSTVLRTIPLMFFMRWFRCISAEVKTHNRHLVTAKWGCEIRALYICVQRKCSLHPAGPIETLLSWRFTPSSKKLLCSRW